MQFIVIVAALAALPVLRATDHQPVQPAGEGRLEAILREAVRQLDAGELRDVVSYSLLRDDLT